MGRVMGLLSVSMVHWVDRSIITSCFYIVVVVGIRTRLRGHNRGQRIDVSTIRELQETDHALNLQLVDKV